MQTVAWQIIVIKGPQQKIRRSMDRRTFNRKQYEYFDTYLRVLRVFTFGLLRVKPSTEDNGGYGGRTPPPEWGICTAIQLFCDPLSGDPFAAILWLRLFVVEPLQTSYSYHALYGNVKITRVGVLQLDGVPS